MSADVKSFKEYEELVSLLETRGMDVGDRDEAIATLQRLNYYRLSGYWYSFREHTSTGRGDDFYEGTRLSDVVALHDFDVRLRAAAFAAMVPLELKIRALLGHELGRIDSCAHLKPDLLGPTARQGTAYTEWLERYESQLDRSREDFVKHHSGKYGGQLPVWAATEILDWGQLSHLYGFAPEVVRKAIAEACELSPPQLQSWLKALNLIRNTCAHHGRLFNRVHTITPKLPRVGRHADLDAISTDWSRTFGQLTLVQFLCDRWGVGNRKLLIAVMKTFPAVTAVTIHHTGADERWHERSSLWRDSLV